MNYSKIFLIVLSISATACNAMHLNFKGTYEGMGKGQGKKAVSKQLENKKTDMLQPLLDKLESAANTLTHQPKGDVAFETKTIFEGFVVGYAAGLLQHNNYNKDQLSFDTDTFNGKFNTEKEQNKSREELVTFLTTTFTKAQLLTEK